VYPPCFPNNIPRIFISPHKYRLYSWYFIISSTVLKCLLVALRWIAYAIGTEAKVLPLCSITAVKLVFEASINKYQPLASYDSFPN
jgi:hypothetical protein